MTPRWYVSHLDHPPQLGQACPVPSLYPSYLLLPSQYCPSRPSLTLQPLPKFFLLPLFYYLSLPSAPVSDLQLFYPYHPLFFSFQPLTLVCLLSCLSTLPLSLPKPRPHSSPQVYRSIRLLCLYLSFHLHNLLLPLFNLHQYLFHLLPLHTVRDSSSLPHYLIHYSTASITYPQLASSLLHCSKPFSFSSSSVYILLHNLFKHSSHPL